MSPPIRRRLLLVAAGGCLLLAQIYSLYSHNKHVHNRDHQSVKELRERVNILELKLENHIRGDEKNLTTAKKGEQVRIKRGGGEDVNLLSQAVNVLELKLENNRLRDEIPHLTTTERGEQRSIKPEDKELLDVSAVSSLVRDFHNKPSMVYIMHVPKTGGRTAMYTITDWRVNRRINCWIPWCCAPFRTYINYTANSINQRDGTVGGKAGKCQAIAQEISVPGILKTKELLNKTKDRWYMFSLFGNPLARFLSVSRHHVRENRCDNKYRREKPDALTDALALRLNGTCYPPREQEDQAEYYFRAPWNPKEPFYYFPSRTNSTSAGVADAWSEMRYNFDWIGLTHRMDESFCVLALELAAFGFMPLQQAYDTACAIEKKKTQQHVRSTKKGDPDTDPVTTQQVMRILKDKVPVDVQVYPRLLQFFHDKLEKAMQAILQQANKENKGAATRHFQSVLTSITQEQRAWRKVSAWVKAAKEDDAKLLKQLEGLTNEEKNLIAPKMKWGQQRTEKLR